jgi:hypothetical protein
MTAGKAIATDWVLAFVNGHRSVEYDFAGLPLRPAMARSLAEQFAQFVEPDGTGAVGDQQPVGVRHASTAVVRPLR